MLKLKFYLAFTLASNEATADHSFSIHVCKTEPFISASMVKSSLRKLTPELLNI